MDADKPLLSLDQIRAADDVKEELVEMPEWGGAVRMRGVNVAEGLELLNMMQGADGKIDNEKAMMYAALVGVVEPKFSEADLPWLKTKSLSALTRITTVFNRLSGFSEVDLAKAKNAS